MTNEISEVKSSLDTLWNRVAQYRNSTQFYEMMRACASFRDFAPYNAMLIQMQRPGARCVQTERQWKEKYGRNVKPNARPIIILVPFGPVEFVFDIGDTVANDMFMETDESILDKIAEPYKTKKPIDRNTLNTLITNLNFHGIAFDYEFVGGAGYAAKIELRDDLQHIKVPLNKNLKISLKARYLLSVRKDAGDGECFASICHELGHLFCHHLAMPRGWKEKQWQVRCIGQKLEEFEAESASWLICERLGIGNPSEMYLSSYIKSNETISPSVSIERILAATKEVENMLKPMTYRDGLLFKHDKDFRRTIIDLKRL